MPALFRSVDEAGWDPLSCQYEDDDGHDAPVLHSFAYALDYLREQVAEVAPSDMVAQPNGIMNHPAWVIGHLTFTCQMLGGAIGLREWLASDFANRYGTGSVPVADVHVYYPKVRALAM